MLTTVLPALIAAVAALGGVAVGALLEPFKVATAQRARVHQERLGRCAELVDLANQSRGQAVGINRVFRGERPAVASPEWPRWDELNQPFYDVRARLRTVVGVLRIYGPDDLARAAEVVRTAESALAGARFSQHSSSEDANPGSLPRAVKDAIDSLDAAVTTFAEVAARHAR